MFCFLCIFFFPNFDLLLLQRKIGISYGKFLIPIVPLSTAGLSLLLYANSDTDSSEYSQLSSGSIFWNKWSIHTLEVSSSFGWREYEGNERKREGVIKNHSFGYIFKGKWKGNRGNGRDCHSSLFLHILFF